MDFAVRAFHERDDVSIGVPHDHDRIVVPGRRFDLGRRPKTLTSLSPGDLLVASDRDVEPGLMGLADRALGGAPDLPQRSGQATPAASALLELLDDLNRLFPRQAGGPGWEPAWLLIGEFARGPRRSAGPQDCTVANARSSLQRAERRAQQQSRCSAEDAPRGRGLARSADRQLAGTFLALLVFLDAEAALRSLSPAAHSFVVWSSTAASAATF